MTPKPRREKQYRDVGLAPKVVPADRQFQQELDRAHGDVNTTRCPMQAVSGTGTFPRTMAGRDRDPEFRQGPTNCERY